MNRYKVKDNDFAVSVEIRPDGDITAQIALASRQIRYSLLCYSEVREFKRLIVEDQEALSHWEGEFFEAWWTPETDLADLADSLAAAGVLATRGSLNRPLW